MQEEENLEQTQTEEFAEDFTDGLLDQLYDDEFEDEEQEDEVTEAPIPDTPVADEKKYKLNIDGEEREVGLSDLKNNDKLLEELVKNGLRRDDYTQKTMQLADQRRQQDQEAERRVAEIEQYLPWQEHNLKSEYEKILQADFMAIHKEDPVEAQALMLRKEAIEREFNQIQQVKQEVSTFRQNQNAARLAAETEPAYQILRENIPLLVNGSSTEIAALKNELVAHGQKKFGLSPEEFSKLDGILGARTLVAIADSLELSKLKTNSKDIIRDRAVKKQSPRMESPTSNNNSVDADDLLIQSKKARKSGSLREINKSTDALLDQLFN